MKVLYYTNIPSPYRVDFFNKLGQHCDLTVLFDRNDAENRESSWLQGEDQYRCFNALVMQGIKMGEDSALCTSICRYWKDPQYDIRIVGDYATPTGILSIFYMHCRNIPFQIECDGGFLRESEGELKYRLKRFLISHAQYAFSPGFITDKYLIHYGLKNNRILRYHFSSLNEKDLLEAKKALGSREQYRKEMNLEDKKIVLFVGQIIERKGVDLLIRAAAKISDDYMVLIAGGEPTEEYLALMNDLSVANVRFVGFHNKASLRKYYASADVFVLPTREDIWGLVIAEAMSYGLPVVTTKMCVAGMELLGDQEYSIIETEDVDQLADSIIRITTSSTGDLSEENLRIVKHYTIEQMVNDHLLGFERIMRNE